MRKIIKKNIYIIKMYSFRINNYRYSAHCKRNEIQQNSNALYSFLHIKCDSSEQKFNAYMYRNVDLKTVSLKASYCTYY
jgi:hypothetical protein